MSDQGVVSEQPKNMALLTKADLRLTRVVPTESAVSVVEAKIK